MRGGHQSGQGKSQLVQAAALLSLLGNSFWVPWLASFLSEQPEAYITPDGARITLKHFFLAMPS